MIGKNTIKWIKSLEMKKNRKREGLFVAEGPKVVGDLMSRFRLHTVFATREWQGGEKMEAHVAYHQVEDDELRRLSFLQHPQQVMAVFEMNKEEKVEVDADRITLMLDGVQDPGNLGTIIRIADWFGIRHVICSQETADAYNPKVVQATMGSLASVSVHYVNLESYLVSQPKDVKIYGTLLDGQDIYETRLSAAGIIVMGNEGNGLTEAVRRLVTHRLLIPDFNPDKRAESLNVAIATSIVCSEFRRRG